MQYRPSSGFSVVEIIVAAAIIVTVITSAAGAWKLYIATTNLSAEKSQAALLTEEASEILRLFRDQSWTNFIAPLNLGTAYQLYWTGDQYAITTNQILFQNRYVRTFTLSSVNRDSGDNIVSSGGTTDSNTKKATMSVFLVGATSTPIMQTEMLIHNVYNN